MLWQLLLLLPSSSWTERHHHQATPTPPLTSRYTTSFVSSSLSLRPARRASSNPSYRSSLATVSNFPSSALMPSTTTTWPLVSVPSPKPYSRAVPFDRRSLELASLLRPDSLFPCRARARSSTVAPSSSSELAAHDRLRPSLSTSTKLHPSSIPQLQATPFSTASLTSSPFASSHRRTATTSPPLHVAVPPPLTWTSDPRASFAPCSNIVACLATSS